MDVSGSAGAAVNRRGLRTTFDDALQCVTRVDADASVQFRTRLSTLWPALLHDTTEGNSGKRRYWALEPADRDRLTGVVADLVSQMEINAVT